MKESFYIGSEAVEVGLADRVDTFEQWKDRVFYNAKVNEIVIDKKDDFDLNSLEMTSRRWSQITE